MLSKGFLYAISSVVIFVQLLLVPALGAKEVKHAKILICGVAKNVEGSIPATIKSIEKIGKQFKDYRVILYENNSTDKTAVKFKKWALENRRVQFISEHLSEKEFYTTEPTGVERKMYRVELISRARNIVLSIAMKPEYDDYDYVLMADLDFRKSWDIKGIMSSFKFKGEWDAITANGLSRTDRYFDMYAFRDKQHPLGPELYGPDWWTKIVKWRDDIKLSSSDPFRQVISAFGGLGIYKRSSIVDCSYSALPTQDLEDLMTNVLYGNVSNPKALADISHYFTNVNELPGLVIHENGLKWLLDTFMNYHAYPVLCEHVTFHASMIRRGHDKIYINPRMIMRY